MAKSKITNTSFWNALKMAGNITLAGIVLSSPLSAHASEKNPSCEKYRKAVQCYSVQASQAKFTYENLKEIKAKCGCSKEIKERLNDLIRLYQDIEKKGDKLGRESREKYFEAGCVE